MDIWLPWGQNDIDKMIIKCPTEDKDTAVVEGANVLLCVLCACIYIYIYIYTCVCIYIYMYVCCVNLLLFVMYNVHMHVCIMYVCMYV